MDSYQAYVSKLDNHIKSFDDYISMNSFRVNRKVKIEVKIPSPNSMVNTNFEDISLNLRSHIVRSVK